MEQAPIRLLQFTKSFHIGGTEGQVVELLRGLPSSYRVQVAVLQDTGPLLEAVHRLGYTPTEFSLQGSLASPNTARQIVRLARWLKHERVQLVHVHDFYSTMLVVPAAKLAGTKVIDEVGAEDVALCTHGDVIPIALDLLVARGMRPEDDLAWQKGSVWVVERSDGAWGTGRYLPPPDSR